jgi:FkbM family methyltransferase
MAQIEIYQCRHGVMAHFAADQCVGLSLREYGEWAEDEIALLAPYVSTGATVLDVGANVGTHTLAFARLAGPTGRVLAIEGHPETFALLSYNVVENGHSLAFCQPLQYQESPRQSDQRVRWNSRAQRLQRSGRPPSTARPDRDQGARRRTAPSIPCSRRVRCCRCRLPAGSALQVTVDAELSPSPRSSDNSAGLGS